MSTFNWIDYTIIAIIALSVLISVMRGFVREVISLVIWVAAIAVSFIFYRYIADLLVNFIHSDSVRLVVSFVGLFLVTLVLGMLINYLIGQLVANTGLSGTDRVLGIIFGIARGILVVVLLMTLVSLTPFAKEAVLDELLLVDRLFQGDTRTFHENRNNELAKEKQAFDEARLCIQKNKGLAKTIQPNNYAAFMRQLEDLNHRPPLRETIYGAERKFVHLTGKVVAYTKKRRKKDVYSHTKKTSTTLLSEQLKTPLFNEAPGFLFHQDQCKVKARMLQTSRTFSHEWLGDETEVNQYKTLMQRFNETDERKFVTYVKNSNWTNEVLAQLNKDALRAVIVMRDTPEALQLALSRRNELRDKFSLNLPIIFYNTSQRSLAYYRLKEINSLAKQLMLNVYRLCLEKQDWKPGFFANNAPIENKLTPKTVSFIKELVEDAQQKEQANNSANDTIWLDVKNKVETKLNSVCNSVSVSQFFRGRSTNTQNFYQDVKNFMDNQTNNDNWSAPIKPAI